MTWRSPKALDLPFTEPFGEISGDIADIVGASIRQQAGGCGKHSPGCSQQR
jgi:hypothetical protein